MTTPAAPRNTAAFNLQATLAFGLSLTFMIVGIWYLPVEAWTRAFLAMGTLFLTSSCLTLAKVVRDAQESGSVVSRLDQARLERLLAEFDPYGVPAVARAAAHHAQPADDPLLTLSDRPVA